MQHTPKKVISVSNELFIYDGSLQANFEKG